jgi:TolB protein
MTKLRRLVPLAALVALFTGGSGAIADEPKKPADPTTITPPDESVLGVVPVTDSGASPPPPKLAVVPIATTSDADSVVQAVVRRDLDLTGLYDVVPTSVVPDGAGDFTHDTVVDQKGWQAKGVALVVRVFANAPPAGATEVELTGEAYLVGKSPKAAFTKTMKSPPGDVRLTAHKMTDSILGALTGRPGPFASHLAYTTKVGKATPGQATARQVFLVEADGQNAKAYSPATDTALSPALGPGGLWYYALSHDYSPFRLVKGPKATPVPLSVSGSVLGLTFSNDRSKLAVAVMDAGFEDVYVGAADGSTPMKAMIAPPLAAHPTFGPMGRIAYVAGSSLPRVYVEKTPISPAGFHASAPTFCDTPRGLLVIFNVGVGANADLVATDVNGGGLIRLTQNQGANSTPACSPDGRLVAFFSTRKTGGGPGLYVMPISSPWRSQRISTEMGESLAWEMDP